MKWFTEIIDRLFVVAGAALFSQLPIYMQEYQQRLAGHVDELGHQLATLRKLAKEGGKTLEQYIEKFLASGDADFVAQGAFLESMQYRFLKLSDALRGLQESTVFSKPFLFLKSIDFSIGKETLYSFQPGLLFTVEGACYLLAGMAVGYAFFRLLSSLRFAVIRHGNQGNQH